MIPLKQFPLILGFLVGERYVHARGGFKLHSLPFCGKRRSHRVTPWCPAFLIRTGRRERGPGREAGELSY